VEHLLAVEMKPARVSEGAAASLRTSTSTAADRPPTTWHQAGREGTQRSQDAGVVPMSGIVTYRGIRGLKHRNDRLHRSATVAAVLDRPLEKTATERQSSRQNVADQCPSFSDQRRPVHLPSSRRSASADRQAVSTYATSY